MGSHHAALKGLCIPAPGNARGPSHKNVKSALKVRRMFHLGLVDRDMRHPCRVRGWGLCRVPGLHPGLVCRALSGLHLHRAALKGRVWCMGSHRAALKGLRIPAPGTARGSSVTPQKSALKVRRMFHLGQVDRDMRHPYRVRGFVCYMRFPGLHPGLVCGSPFRAGSKLC